MWMKKVGVYERRGLGGNEKGMNEEDYVLTSDDEQMNEPSNFYFVEQKQLYP